MPIDHWNEKVDGPLTEEAMRRKMEKMDCVVHRYVYPPGTHFPPHTHEMDKMDGVISGHFRLQMGDHRLVLEAGDMLTIRRGELHSAEVVGNEAVVSLDGIIQECKANLARKK